MSRKRKAAVTAVKSKDGSDDESVAKVVKKCPTCQVSLQSLQIDNTHNLEDFGDAKEWQTGNDGASPACINMGDKFQFTLYLDVDVNGDSFDGLTLKVTLTITPEDEDSYDWAMTYEDITLDETKIYSFNFTSNDALNEGVDVTTVVFKDLEITGDDNVELDDPGEIEVEIFTIFDNPLADNVKESTLVAPDADADEGNDEVNRIEEFFTSDHVRRACKWARGAKLHKPKGGIVQNIVRNIPQITYAEGKKWVATNDGWNVWDNTKLRTADCSQLASFFADVLGTIGIRGHDLELKCDTIHEQKLYRRAFGDKPGWPTHGVLLVNYRNSGHYCYDTTFSDPRKIVTLAKAITVGDGEFVDKWYEWWELAVGGAVLDTKILKKVITALNASYGTVWWQGQMRNKAANLFPDGEEQDED